MLDDLCPDERRIAFMHGPLEFVGTPCFKQDACDIDSNGGEPEGIPVPIFSMNR